VPEERVSNDEGAPHWKEVAEGLLYTHTRLNENSKTAVEAASFLYGLIELLTEKGLIAVDELDDRKKAIATRMVNNSRDRGMGVLLQDPETDKYTTTEVVEIDCENRLPLCRAACCKLPFALSKQDVYEGVVRWDLGQPYMIAHSADGYCTHLERGNCHCTIREHRPLPCRAYDCSKGNKIWIDFEKRIINPDILKPDWPWGADNANGSTGGA
jgi:Fe-S-cluster containining protein